MAGIISYGASSFIGSNIVHFAVPASENHEASLIFAPYSARFTSHNV